MEVERKREGGKEGKREGERKGKRKKETEQLSHAILLLLCTCRVKPEVQSTASKFSRLHDLKELPVYAQPCKMLTTQEAMGVLSSEL